MREWLARKACIDRVTEIVRRNRRSSATDADVEVVHAAAVDEFAAAASIASKDRSFGNDRDASKMDERVRRIGEEHVPRIRRSLETEFTRMLEEIFACLPSRWIHKMKRNPTFGSVLRDFNKIRQHGIRDGALGRNENECDQLPPRTREHANGGAIEEVLR